MACICQRAVRVSTGSRAFSTTSARPVSLHLGVNDRDLVADTIPPYPYGPARWYKQSDLGLYGGRKIMFGNNTSEKYQTRKRRAWYPNVQTKRLFSKALNHYVQLRVTTRVMRTIDKLGGLDEYLLGEKEARIKELGLSGWWLRWAVMQTPAVRQRFMAERERYGLIASPAEEEAIPGQSDLPTSSPQTEHSMDKSTNLASSEQADNSSTASAHASANDSQFSANSTDLTLKEYGKGLRFRIGRRKYLQMHNGRWKERRPIIGRLKHELYKHSPTEAVKRWQVIEENFTENMAELSSKSTSRLVAMKPTLDQVRTEFFKAQRARVRQIQEELKQVGNVGLKRIARPSRTM